MEYSTLDTVVLNRDLPEHGLKLGDLGTIVEVYEPAASRSNSLWLRAAPAPCSRSGLETSATLPMPISSPSGSSHAPRRMVIVERSTYEPVSRKTS